MQSNLFNNMLQLQGIARIFLRDSVNSPWVYNAEYHNAITLTAKDQILRSIAQSATGTKLSGTAFAQRMAFCSGTAPTDIVKDDLDSNGATALSYETLTVINPLIDVTSSKVSVTFEATYTAVAIQTVNFIAMVCNASDMTIGNTYAVIEIAPYGLDLGQGLKCEYTMTFNYYVGGGSTP